MDFEHENPKFMPPKYIKLRAGTTYKGFLTLKEAVLFEGANPDVFVFDGWTHGDLSKDRIVFAPKYKKIS